MFNGLQSHFSWVQGRNCHFLELGDSLPGGGYQPARNLRWVCALSIVLSQFPLDVVRGTLLFLLVGCDFARAVSLEHHAVGHPMEMLGSGSQLLPVSLGERCTYRRGVFFTDQSPRPLSPWGQAWLVLERGNQPVHLVGRSCLGSQEGFAWLGSQTLWVNLRAGCPGAQSSATLGWQFLPSYMNSYLPFLHQVCSFPCSRELQLWCLTLDFTAATFHLYCSVLTVCSCQRFAAKNAVESETLPSCIFLYCSLENTIWVINNM